jgi:hypothetical protein
MQRGTRLPEPSVDTETWAKDVQHARDMDTKHYQDMVFLAKCGNGPHRPVCCANAH